MRERERAENSAVTSGGSGPEDGVKSWATLFAFASSARSLLLGDPGRSAWSGGGGVWSLWTVWSTGVGVAMLGWWSGERKSGLVVCVLKTVCGRPLLRPPEVCMRNVLRVYRPANTRPEYEDMAADQSCCGRKRRAGREDLNMFSQDLNPLRSLISQNQFKELQMKLPIVLFTSSCLFIGSVQSG